MTIVTALEARGIELRKVGEDRWRLACPVHAGSNPGAMACVLRDGVYLFHCYNCGFGGDDVDLLVAMGVSKREAMDTLRPPRDPSKPRPVPPPPKPPCSCTGPFGCQRCTYAPPRSKGLVLGCCKCGLETDPRYTSCWELSSDGIADICPACCEGFPVHVDTRDRRTMAYEHALQLARCVALGDVQMLPHLASMLDLMEST